MSDIKHRVIELPLDQVDISTEIEFSFLPTKRLCGCPEKHLNCLSHKELLQLGSTVIDVKPRQRWKEKHQGRFIPEVPKKFIQLFSHRGETVLDPFCGSGTTNVVAHSLERCSIGIDVNPYSIRIAHRRLLDEAAQLFPRPYLTHRLIQGSVLDVLLQIPKETIDLVVTSPPYFDVVDYNDDNPEQWGNIHDYNQFLSKMTQAFRLIFDVLKPKRWLVVDTQDVFKKNAKCPIHADYIRACQEIGFEIVSTQVYILNYSTGGRLVFGYPTSYYPKNDHEYIIIFQKP